VALPTSVLHGVPRFAARSLEASISDIVEALARYGCCVLTDSADACDAWPLLLGAARQVHGADDAIRYRAWGGFDGTWRGYQPSKGDAEAIATVVDVDPAFLDGAPDRRFSAFEVGALWPVAAGVTSGGSLDTPQPWPDVPGFAIDVAEAFVSALRFGEALVRRVLASVAKAVTPSLGAPCSSMRLLRYQAAPTPGEAHLDYELLTMLVSDAPGLEVRDAAGHWRQPEHGPDDLVIMAGDMLEASTQGAIGSGLHRVTADTDRHSAVVFVGMDYGVEVLVPATGKRMPFGQYLEGTTVRTTPLLRSRYEAGTLSLPFPLPEPNPFRGEPWRPE
jgi:isopenicillin N synthase-like dioxygenase